MTDPARISSPGAPDRPRQVVGPRVEAHRIGNRARRSGPCETLHVFNLADVAPEPVAWLWPGRIALGKIAVLTGAPGVGKTLAALSVAARVTSGGAWPCGEGDVRKGNVIVVAGKDGLGDTLRPRIDAAGGDPAGIEVVRAFAVSDRLGRRAFDLAQDLAALEGLIEARGGVRLLVIEPDASLGRPDARAVLEALAEVAERRHLAVLLVVQSRTALARLCTSGAVAAGCFAIEFDRADPSRRLLLQWSNSLSAPMPPLALAVELRHVGAGLSVPCAVWSAAPARAGPMRALASPRSEAAALFLQRALAARALPARAIEREAVAAGLLEQGAAISSSGPFRAAKAFLEIRVERRSNGLRGGGEWIWSLPAVH